MYAFPKKMDYGLCRRRRYRQEQLLFLVFLLLNFDCWNRSFKLVPLINYTNERPFWKHDEEFVGTDSGTEARHEIEGSGEVEPEVFDAGYASSDDSSEYVYFSEKKGLFFCYSQF